MPNLLKKSNLPNKRRLASLEGCKIDLQEELQQMFIAFYEALKKYRAEVALTPPEARARAFEASLLNSKMIASIQKHFPNYWKFGKYKRFILRINGYMILFKKLNSSDKPMNIQTKTVSAIAEQMSLPLFDNDTFVEEPILFFGYQKNRFGEIIDPKLVYIDENQVKWTITEDDIQSGLTDGIVTIKPTGTPPASPKLRKTAAKKKASN